MSVPFEKINTFVFDVDGVLTDGTVWSYDEVEFVRRFYIKDGYAIEKAIQAGYHVVIVSGGNERGVHQRLSFLGIQHIHLGVKHKKNVLEEILSSLHVNIDTVLYMGDDIPDIAPMKVVALPCAPADAAIDTIMASKYVSTHKGGKGAVRDVIEKVMRIRGDWKPEQW
jgi:3-deoxy-D-manno-octulosonate 8-phosphate phosphatase (KDO 8-P phosphatase)